MPGRTIVLASTRRPLLPSRQPGDVHQSRGRHDPDRRRQRRQHPLPRRSHRQSGNDHDRRAEVRIITQQGGQVDQQAGPSTSPATGNSTRPHTTSARAASELTLVDPRRRRRMRPPGRPLFLYVTTHQRPDPCRRHDHAPDELDVQHQRRRRHHQHRDRPGLGDRSCMIVSRTFLNLAGGTIRPTAATAAPLPRRSHRQSGNDHDRRWCERRHPTRRSRSTSKAGPSSTSPATGNSTSTYHFGAGGTSGAPTAGGLRG